MSDQMTYETVSWEPETAAGCLRVFLLENQESGIDTLEPWVRFRIQEAAEILDRCAERLKALEQYVELIQEADRKAFAWLCISTANPEERKDEE